MALSWADIKGVGQSSGITVGAGVMSLREMARIAALAALYYGAAKLGLALAFVHASATPVWPPTGISLAALLVYGNRLWPGIALGAFLANLFTAGTAATSLGIATGNTLEALLGAYLVRRYASTPSILTGSKNVFAFLVLAALSSTTVSATVGVTTLALGGYASWVDYGQIWFTWWLGDVVGALVVAPPLLLWARRRKFRLPRRHVLHVLVLACTAAITAALVFWARVPGYRDWPLSFLCIPVLIWAAFRFGARGAATITLLISAIAVTGAVRSHGDIAPGSMNESLLFLQAFMGVMSVLGLTLATVVSEGGQAREALQTAHDLLEQRVAERTTALASAVDSLHAEALEHEATRERLVASESSLARAQELAHLGSWSWDLASGRVQWSDELYRIFGFEPQSIPISYAFFLDRVHADDRRSVGATIRRAFRSGDSFDLVHRIVREDGSLRWLQGLGEVLVENGQAVALYGTAHDITAQKLAETERVRLGHELIEVNHREQQRLGQELHDDIGQLLTGISFLAKTMEQKLTTRHHPEAAAIREIRSLVTSALDKMRILARGLSAATVAEEGLEDALSELAANTERLFGVTCQFELQGSPREVSSWAAVHQYRIVQEAVSNAIRHGMADRISIVLSTDEEGTALQVRDNGSGFGTDCEAKDGLGLRIMRYRAELIGGSVEIESTPGDTCVHCRLPVAARGRGTDPAAPR